MMTSMERVGSALQGRFADRRPFTLVLSLYGARLGGTEPERYYRDPGLYAAGQQAVAEAFDPDILFGPFALALEAESWAAELAWPSRSPPNLKKPTKGGAAAILDMEPPDPTGSPGLAYLVESLALVAKATGGSRPVAGILTSPVDLPALMLGIDGWMETLLFDRETAGRLLELSVAHFKALSAAYFSAGAAFVATPVMFANPRILNQALIEEIVLPALREAFSGAGGPVVFHHGATRIEECLPLFRDLPAVAGFVIDEADSLSGARAAVGPSALLLGGFSGPLMEARSAERTVGLAKAAMEDRREDPRFILCSSAADVPWDTPPERIEALRQAVIEAGGS